MAELENRATRQAVKFFSEGLGNERVAHDGQRITLSFDLDNAEQLRQFNEFGHAANERKLTYLTPRIPEGTMKTHIIIPLPAAPDALCGTAYRMAVRTERKGERNERHRPLTPNDASYQLLSELTGVRDWRHVEKSPYDVEIVQPKLRNPPEPDIRRKQEFGLGYAVLPDAHAPVEIRDWLEHQSEVEKKHDLPPRSAIPADWVRESNVRRAQGRGHLERLKETLPSCFDRGR